MPEGTGKDKSLDETEAIKSNVYAQVIRGARITEDATDQVLGSLELVQEVQTTWDKMLCIRRSTRRGKYK